MVQAAEDWLSSELAEALDRPIARRIFGQGQMRSQFVVVDGVGRKDSPQVRLAEDDNVIETFPANRADQPFRMPVLPGRSRRDRVIADAHGCKARRDGVAVASVAVPESVSLAVCERSMAGCHQRSVVGKRSAKKMVNCA
jgi:hypothetical protein